MPFGTIILIVLAVFVIGALPTWPYAADWGPGPAGILGVVFIVVLALMLIDKI